MKAQLSRANDAFLTAYLVRNPSLIYRISEGSCYEVCLTVQVKGGQADQKLPKRSLKRAICTGATPDLAFQAAYLTLGMNTGIW